jgi:indole-3-glycerol phosphate synthase
VGVLERILRTKSDEIDALRSARLPSPPPPRVVSLKRGSGERLRLIAEIKRRSPSAGALSTRLGVAERAQAYERGGADLISVLCDREFFDGSFAHLELARAACSLPLLCKDFVLDEVQLDAARAFGADAVLLIVRCLTPERVAALSAAAVARGLVPLVEVVTETEARVALDAGAQLIGVNARDLDTLEMDTARAARVLASLPDDVTSVHLSGLATPAQIESVRSSRADAALIGEALMRQDDPLPLLQALSAAARTS